jgi:hypothetical protein
LKTQLINDNKFIGDLFEILPDNLLVPTPLPEWWLPSNRLSVDDEVEPTEAADGSGDGVEDKKCCGFVGQPKVYIIRIY